MTDTAVTFMYSVTNAPASMALARLVLAALRLVVFALSLGLTLIAFDAYRRDGTRQLKLAFVGFAAVSSGIALIALAAELSANAPFRIVATLPLIAGFASLYLSLYR